MMNRKSGGKGTKSNLRERFCFRYARMSENWVSEWSQAFNENFL